MMALRSPQKKEVFANPGGTERWSDGRLLLGGRALREQ